MQTSQRLRNFKEPISYYKFVLRFRCKKIKRRVNLMKFKE